MTITCMVEVEGAGRRGEAYTFATCPGIGQSIALPVRNRPGYTARFTVEAVLHTPESAETGQNASVLLTIKPTAQPASGGPERRHSA